MKTETKTESESTTITETKPLSFEDLKLLIDSQEIVLKNKAIKQLNSDIRFSYEYTTDSFNAINSTKVNKFSVNLVNNSLLIFFNRGFINSKLRELLNISTQIWNDIKVYVEDENKQIFWNSCIKELSTQYKNAFLFN